MLAKLKYLKEEEKALKDIEMAVTEQATRLKQEELYLKSLLRNSGSKPDETTESSSHTFQKQLAMLDDNAVNTTPLEDLQMSSHQDKLSDVMERSSEEEEEEEEEEMDSGDCDELQNDDDGINKDLMALMQQMQGSEFMDDF